MSKTTTPKPTPTTTDNCPECGKPGHSGVCPGCLVWPDPKQSK